jgi:hypothetical protein
VLFVALVFPVFWMISTAFKNNDRSGFRRLASGQPDAEPLQAALTGRTSGPT